MIKQEQIISELRSRFPDFAEKINEHAEYYEEILLHVLFGDFTRFVITKYQNEEIPDVKKALEFIEEMLGSEDEYVDELAHVSFLENLHQADSDYRALIQLLGDEGKRRMEIIDPETGDLKEGEIKMVDEETDINLPPESDEN